MATYHFLTLEERREFQRVWETPNMRPADLAEHFGISRDAAYRELKRGRDMTRLPDLRLAYNAEMAHLSVIQALERRGGKGKKKTRRQLQKED